MTGGEETVAFRRPAVVSLQAGGRHACGGTLISPTTVLTSASCTSGRDLQVRAHVHDLSRSDAENKGSTTKVKTVHRHPDFDADTGRHDIAVLILESAVPDAQPAALPAADSATPQGSELLLAGWGATTQDGALSRVLNTVTVATGDPAACAAAYELDGPGVLCVPPDEGKGACTGDTGGPAIANGVLRAIQTVPGCGRPGQPTALTAVSQYREFIDRWTTR
ncbi:serine protease [Streptomyces bacillaris]|uniref:serine protease n=1 Tax=Streptomyces bacillaris TaxID=68179 RepID=UPI003655ED79